MFEVTRVLTMSAVGVVGLVVAGFGLAGGGRAWVVVVVGAAMTVVAGLVLLLDPPWRNPCRPDFPPRRGPSGRGSNPPPRARGRK